MSNTTSRLRLPYILASQAQKEVTHNETLELIDVLLHACALSIEESAPNAPAAKDCYIVGTAPKGEWKDHANALSYYTTGWNFIQAFEGMTIWIRKEQCHYVYDGSKWASSFALCISNGYPSIAESNTTGSRQLPAAEVAKELPKSNTNINNTDIPHIDTRN